MDASIVIPTKNAGKKFYDVLESIFSQETNFSFEVICVDSGSTDSTLEIINKFPVRLYEIMPSEFGHGKTRNFGASKSAANYVVFLTQDALPYNKYWLNELVGAMEDNKDVVGAFGRHVSYKESGPIEAVNLETHFRNFGDKNTVYFLEDKKKYENDVMYRQFLGFFSDNNSCVRKSVFNRFPYNDVDFAEDQIWMKSMIEKGYKKVYVPDAIVYHSHNYSYIETLHRSFDEYKHLYFIYGYKIAESFTDFLAAWIRICKNDVVNKVRVLKMKKTKKIIIFINCCIKNFFSCYGGYKGYLWHNYNRKKQKRMDKKYSQYYRLKID